MNKQAIIILLSLITLKTSAQNTILWSIKDVNGGKTSFILGTYHQMGNSFVDSLPIIKEKLLESDVAIFESVDDNNILAQQINNRPINQRTMDFIKDSKFDEFKNVSKNWSVDINKLTPAEIIIKLNQSLPRILCETSKPSDTFTHFDKYLIYLCKQNNKAILGFESDSLQIKYVNESSISKYNKREKEKIVGLTKTILEKDKSQFDCSFENEYKRFDLNYKLNDKCIDQILLQDRNEKWVPILLQKLKSENCFIAVGLYHLYFECGLINQLRKNGFIVEEITLK